jgi:hypothetical protein
MLRLLMIVSGTFEALFGLSALIAPDMLVGSLGTDPNAASFFLARILGAATLGLGPRFSPATTSTAKAASPRPMGSGSTTCSPPVSSFGLPWGSAARRYGAPVSFMP